MNWKSRNNQNAIADGLLNRFFQTSQSWKRNMLLTEIMRRAFPRKTAQII